MARGMRASKTAAIPTFLLIETSSDVFLISGSIIINVNINVNVVRISFL
jgi:hypothetical protein